MSWRGESPSTTSWSVKVRTCWIFRGFFRLETSWSNVFGLDLDSSLRSSALRPLGAFLKWIHSRSSVIFQAVSVSDIKISRLTVIQKMNICVWCRCSIFSRRSCSSSRDKLANSGGINSAARGRCSLTAFIYFYVWRDFKGLARWLKAQIGREQAASGQYFVSCQLLS